MAAISRTVQWTIDDFDVYHAPCEYVEPHVSVDGDAATVRYAVQDQDQREFDFVDGVKLFQADHRYVSPHEEAEVQAMDHVFLIERYEHGLVSYSLVADEKPYPDRQWDVATPVGIIGLSDDFDEPRKAAASWLEEYTAWANGEVYGVVEETYTKDADGEWHRDAYEPWDVTTWGVIGSEWAEQLVNDGL